MVLVRDMYMKVNGDQTTTDISPGRNVPLFMGGNVLFSIKNLKYQYWYKIIFFKILGNFFFNAVFGKNIQTNKMQKNQICVIPSGVTILVFV